MKHSSWPAAQTIDTARLVLEPLRLEHARELYRALDDEVLHEFTGGRPAAEAEMSARVARQVRGTSSDGSQGWCNWAVRHRETTSVVGTVQATFSAEPPDRVAEIAWVVSAPHHAQGIASEAAAAMALWVLAHGARTLVAHIHPGHHASMGVARRIGLAPSAVIVDGETRWSTA